MSLTAPLIFQDFPPELAALTAYGPYRASADRNPDGDTVRCWMNLGVDRYPYVSIRIADFSAPEMHEPGGPEAQAHLASLLPRGTPLVLYTTRVAKPFAKTFERYVARVKYVIDGVVRDVAEDMAEAGYAI